MRPIRLRGGPCIAGSLLLAAWLVGQAARDAYWLTALCFYIPSAFLAASFVAMSVFYAVRRQSRRSLLALALAVPPLAFVGLVENRFHARPPPVRNDSLRIVHWNIGRKLDPRGAQRVLLAQRADAYVMSEIVHGGAVQRFRDALGEPYRAVEFGSLALVAKGNVRSRGWLIRRGGVRVHSAQWDYAGHSVTLFAVDLPSNILVWRAPLLEEVMALVARDRPDLIVGDFNAPRRSRALTALPPGYRHAYDAVGNGFGYTWPIPLPLYALDQCIAGPRVAPVGYSLGASLSSDHCYQVLDFVLDGATAQDDRDR